MIKGGAFLYPALLKTVVLPPVIAQILVRLFDLPQWVALLLHILAFPALYIARSELDVFFATQRARRLGARDIPRVTGRWPLNLDVLVDWAKSGSEQEVGRMMVLLGRKYGRTYNTRVLGEDQIISTDPAVLKHVLITDFDNFPKGRKFQQRAEGFLGDGIFNADGERWKFHRALTRSFFHPSHISPKLFSPLIVHFLERLPEPHQGPFDIQAALGQLSLKMAIKWLCGADIADLNGGTSCAELGQALVVAQRVVGKRVKIGTVWPLLELGHDPLEKPMKIIRAFFAPLIDSAMARRASRRTEQAPERQSREEEDDRIHLIDRLIDSTDDRKLIEDQLINLLLASRDTTTSLLTFLVYALVLHPSIAAVLRQEIAAATQPGAEVTKDVIRECRKCRAFINETLRLFPPVPLNIRRSSQPTLLPSSDRGKPLFMPGNTSIILNFVLMQRDPVIWGDDAEIFDISRWDDMGPEREAFMSWNLGPRMCLGQPLALAIAHTFLVHLCQHLDDSSKTTHLVLADQPIQGRMPDTWRDAKLSDGRARHGRDKVWIVSDVVLAVKAGLWVKLEPKTAST